MSVAFLGKINIFLIQVLNLAAVQLQNMTVEVQSLSHLSPALRHHLTPILQEI